MSRGLAGMSGTRAIIPIAAAALALGAPPWPGTPAAAKPRPARCVIEATGIPTWRGPCVFEAERGGSFTITPPEGQSFANGVGAISLGIVSPGVGEVRGLTSDGINSRWGEARRSTRDRACWAGSDFSLCVY
ncbi:MAG: hypothetical protein ACXWUP_04885 [Allosphingosinicella sp.]